MTPDAEALRDRAFAAFEAGRLAEAVVCFDGLLRLANIPKFYAAQALYNMSVAFGLLDNPEAEIAACQELILRFGAAEEPQIETLLASALVNKGVALIRLARPDLALDAFAEVVHRYADAEDPALKEQVEKALVDSSAVLSEQGRHKEALERLAQALPRLNSPAAIASVLVNQSHCYFQLGQGEEALAACEQLLARFSGNTDPEIQAALALGLLNKGESLSLLGRTTEARAVYEDVLTRYATRDGHKYAQAVSEAKDGLRKLGN